MHFDQQNLLSRTAGRPHVICMFKVEGQFEVEGQFKVEGETFVGGRCHSNSATMQLALWLASTAVAIDGNN